MKLEKAYEIFNPKIQFVSLVDKAANMKKFLIVKEEDGKATFTTYGRIIKRDTANHFVTGIVYEPMEEDAHGNYMTEQEITKAAYSFAKNGNKIDLQHSFEKLDGATVVESWIAKSDFAIDKIPIRKGTWLMTVEITDEDVWKAIEKGEITGFSMGGVGNYSAVDVELPEDEGIISKVLSRFGLKPIDKGAVTDCYNRYATEANFYDAFDALRNALERWNPVTQEYSYENDEEVIREALQEFNEIVVMLLAEKSVTNALNGMRKDASEAGKKVSGSELKTLKSMQKTLSTLIAEADDEETEDVKLSTNTDNESKSIFKKFASMFGFDVVEKKAGENTASERERNLSEKEESVEKAGRKISDANRNKLTEAYNALGELLALTEPSADVQEEQKKDSQKDDPETKDENKTPEEKPEEKEPGDKEQEEEKKEDKELKKSEVIQLINETAAEAVSKALSKQQPAEDETIVKEDVEQMITKAVDEAMQPLLKARGLSAQIEGDAGNQKQQKEHYLHGIL